jgi:DNA-binding transcriptional LysR family regulator
MSFAIDLFDLRLFIHVAETRSLTRGAERACISLGAASTRIKNMEETIGARLLNRTSNGMVMTAAGEMVLAHARQVHRQMERLRADLQENQQGMRGRVHIQADTSAITEYLPEALADFLGRHAGVGIELKEALSDETVRAVTEGQADIGVVAADVETGTLTTRPFGVGRLVLVVNSRSALARQSVASFRGILKEPQVGLQEDSVLHRFLSREAEHVGRSFHPRAQVGSFEAICRMVESGVGVAVVPLSSVLRHASTLDILCIPLVDSWAQRELRLITRAQSELTALTREVFQHLSEAAQRAPATPAAPQRRRLTMETALFPDRAGGSSKRALRAGWQDAALHDHRERAP